jgi:hypothetical protein
MDSVAEVPPPTEKPKRVPHFTKENAKAYNAKAIEAKRLAAIERQKAIEAAKVVTELAPDEKYRLERLARTREQIARLDAQLLASNDPREIKALSDALKNFAEMERILRREPLPGSRRPGREKPERASGNAGPLDAE